MQNVVWRFSPRTLPSGSPARNSAPLAQTYPRARGVREGEGCHWVCHQERWSRDGHASGSPSGDIDIDHPAWGSITNQIHFHPCPASSLDHMSRCGSASRNPDDSYGPCIEVSVSPVDLQVPVGGSKTVTATVRGTKENNVGWSVSGLGCSGSACGEITKDFYRAPSPAESTIRDFDGNLESRSHCKGFGHGSHRAA
jgi:hypothetical protein